MCKVTDVVDVTDTNCKVAVEMATNGYLITSEWIQIVVSIANTVLVCSIVKIHWRRKGTFHSNFMVLAATYGLLQALYDLSNIATYVPNQIRRWSCGAPCSLLTPGFVVFALRIPRSFYLIGVTLLQVSAILERILAIKCGQDYEKVGRLPGILLAVVPISACIGGHVFVYHDFTFLDSFPYTTLTHAVWSARLGSIYLWLRAINGTSLVIYAVIWLTNRTLIKNKVKERKYSLARNYQLSENQAVMAAIIPCAISQTISFILIIGIAFFIRTFEYAGQSGSLAATEYGYTLTPLCAFVALNLYRRAIMSQWNKPKFVDPKAEAALYFRQLKSQWA
ncbi:hypothetical protein AAVH_16202 [Aphelenchoides avenae]|nr:hypothetical protein AAVH_16202 [Aphelenchus avenae]